MSDTLAVFDFDHTVVHDNTDVVAERMISDRSMVKTLRADVLEQKGWTAYMQGVFEILSNLGVSVDQIRTSIEAIPLVAGMQELLTFLKELKAQSIIISDANTLFIEWLLEANGLQDKFTAYFSNPARISESTIVLTPYHDQTDCEMSSRNMCKGRILKEYLAKQNGKIKRTIYVGDGNNDFCPASQLKEGDFVFCRKNYALESLIEKSKPLRPEKYRSADIVATVTSWENGLDIIQTLEKCGFS